jgi:hypothetical protein
MAPVLHAKVTEHRVRFVEKAEHIFLPVSVNGRSYRFVLDTGCNMVSFGCSLKKELGDPIEKTSVLLLYGGGRVDAEVRPAPRQFSVGSLAIDVPRVHVFDDPAFSDGILGMDLLRRFSVEIDFDSGEVVFREPSHKAEVREGYGVKFSKLEPVPFVKVEMAGMAVEMLLDTGHPGDSFLDHDVFKQIVHRTGQSKIVGKVVPIGDGGRDESTVLETIEVIATTFSVAGLQYNNAVFGDRNHSALGMAFLKAHKKVVLDFPNGDLYLVPRAVLVAPTTHPGDALGPR